MGNAPNIINTKCKKRKTFRNIGYFDAHTDHVTTNLQKEWSSTSNSTEKMDLSYIYRIICSFIFFPLSLFVLLFVQCIEESLTTHHSFDFAYIFFSHSEKKDIETSSKEYFHKVFKIKKKWIETRRREKKGKKWRRREDL